jgi:hypothetical protein
MNQDESNRMLHNGAWPQIAGRACRHQRSLGQPDGVLELYQLGSEARNGGSTIPTRRATCRASGIFHRCNLSGTCPKVIEHFGGSEVFALKMTMEWVGTSADFDIPLTAQRAPLLHRPARRTAAEPAASSTSRRPTA